MMVSILATCFKPSLCGTTERFQKNGGSPPPHSGLKQHDMWWWRKAGRRQAPPKIFHVLKKLTPRNERKVRQNHRFWRVLGWVAKSGLRKNGGWEMGGWECGKWKCFRGDAPTVFCWEGYKIDAAI